MSSVDESGYDPAQDPDHEMHDDLYSGWSSTHDYDPRWDYSDELRPHWQQHPLVQEAQARLASHSPDGRVYAADLAQRGVVGLYISGTGAEEPVMLVDPQQHEQHAFPGEASEQMSRTVDHEYRHALQDAEQGPDGPNYDEEDAEHWTPGHTATIPEDFKQLLPKVAKDSRPFKYLWVFDPESDRVHIDFTPKDKPAHFPLHHEMVQKHGVHHPEHQKGWAIAIVNGWRIFTTDLKRPDPYVKRKVEEALEGKHPLPSLPHVRYHGDPQRKAQ